MTNKYEELVGDERWLSSIWVGNIQKLPTDDWVDNKKLLERFQHNIAARNAHVLSQKIPK